MKIHILQHLVFETPGMIADWANENNHSLSYTYLFEKTINYPMVSDFDMLVIMGGTMGVEEESIYPWLKSEKAFIKETIAAHKIVLGICLGSQLLAEALGAKVYPNPVKEIGFYPIFKTDKGKQDLLFNHIPEEWTVFHWHGDTFDLPENAIHLFGSEACPHQVFRKNNCVGIQFHPEVDKKLLGDMVHFEKHELVENRFIQTEREILATNTYEENRAYLYDFLSKLSRLNS